MTQVKAYVPGLYARSGAAESAQRTEEVRSFLGVQREAGMDYFSDGLLDWPDLASPLVRKAQTPARERPTTDDRPGTATEVLSEPSDAPHLYASEMPRGRWVSTLPSPLALARSADLTVSGAASLLSVQVGLAAESGCAFIVLQETRMPEAAELAALGEAIEALRGTLPLVLRLPPGGAAGVIADVVDLPVEAVGVDMVSTDVAALPGPFPKTLLAGVVDATDPKPEEPSRLAARYEGLLGRLDAEADLHLAANGDLRALDSETAARKVHALGDAARILRGG